MGKLRKFTFGALLAGLSAWAAPALGHDGIGDVTLAIADLQKGDTDSALALLTKVIAANSVSESVIPDVYYDRGNVYLARNDYDHAIADFTTAIGLRRELRRRVRHARQCPSGEGRYRRRGLRF